MRPIHLAHLDKTRPVLILTREAVRARLTYVSVAPITSTVRGLSVEVGIGASSGIDHNSVINCDNITTIAVSQLGRQIGYLPQSQEDALTAAIHAAYDLD